MGIDPRGLSTALLGHHPILLEDGFGGNWVGRRLSRQSAERRRPLGGVTISSDMAAAVLVDPGSPRSRCLYVLRKRFKSSRGEFGLRPSRSAARVPCWSTAKAHPILRNHDSSRSPDARSWTPEGLGTPEKPRSHPSRIHRRASRPMRLLHQRDDLCPSKGCSKRNPGPRRIRFKAAARRKPVPLRHVRPYPARGATRGARRLSHAEASGKSHFDRDVAGGRSSKPAAPDRKLRHRRNSKRGRCANRAGSSIRRGEPAQRLRRSRWIRSVDSFLAMHPDGSVTIYTGKVDIGTGLRIAIRQMGCRGVRAIHGIALRSSKAIPRSLRIRARPAGAPASARRA